VARLVTGAARAAGLDDLEQAAAAVAEGGDRSGGWELFKFGYACLEHGLGYLGVRPLARALELVPDAPPVLTELVAALEQDGQHGRAVAVLEEHGPVTVWMNRSWPAPSRKRRKASRGWLNRRIPRGGRPARKCGGCSPAPTPCAT
jgi:hypothetical protein